MECNWNRAGPVGAGRLRAFVAVVSTARRHSGYFSAFSPIGIRRRLRVTGLLLVLALPACQATVPERPARRGPSPSPSPGGFPFTDVTAAAGIRFRHYNGRRPP